MMEAPASSRELLYTWRMDSEDPDSPPASEFDELRPLNGFGTRALASTAATSGDGASASMRGRGPGCGIRSRSAILFTGAALFAAAASTVASRAPRFLTRDRDSVGLQASLGGGCLLAQAGSQCFRAVQWGKVQGIHEHPEWYPGLTAQSSDAEFQALIHARSPYHECPFAPCPEHIVPEGPPVVQVPTPPPSAATPGVTVPPAPLFRLDTARPAGAPQDIQYRWNISCSAPLVPLPAPVVNGVSPVSLMTCGCPPPQVTDASGPQTVCRPPKGMSKMSFYVYRAQGDDEYPPENVNVADLAGVLWYLHNEVVAEVPRKFGITRILRYKLTMQNTKEFFDRYHKQFGPFVAFDSARCTAPQGNALFNELGAVVGCQNLDRYVVNTVRDFDYAWPTTPPPQPPAQGIAWRRRLEGSSGVAESTGEADGARRLSPGHPVDSDGAQARIDPATVTTTTATTTTGTSTTTSTTTASSTTSTSSTLTRTTTTTTFTATLRVPISDSFHGGIWYSLPGPCPEASVGQKTPECLARMPGGRCPNVDGGKFCTYDLEPAGEISLDDLCDIVHPERGVLSYDDWWRKPYSHCVKEVGLGLRDPPCVINREYDVNLDGGVGCDFWRGKHDLGQNLRRMSHIRELFLLKYPDMPADLAEPDCM